MLLKNVILKNKKHLKIAKFARIEDYVYIDAYSENGIDIGAYSKIDSDSITVEAELFSFDGSQRFYEKQIKDVEKFREIGLEIGKILKTKSNNSYKK